VAFGGRLLEKSDFAKYKNTKETLLFNKSKTLYNINLLKKLKREQPINEVIIVEGYMDTISLYQAGFKNVVASMGTSLTKEQARLIKRYTDNVLISYDGDFAGQSATIRSLDIFAGEGFEIKVLTLPDKLDPDEVIKEKGVDFYMQLVADAMPLIDYKLHVLKQGKNLKDLSDKRKFITEALDLIRSVSDTFMQEELLKKVRDLTGISYQSLKQDLDKGTVTVTTSSVGQDDVEITAKYSDNSAISKTERFILSAFIYKKPYAVYDDDIYFNSKVRDKVYNHVLLNEDFKVENLFSLVEEDGAEELSAILSSGDTIFDKPIEEKYYLGCVTTLKKHNITNEIKNLNAEYQKEIDLEKRNEIGNMIQKLTQKLINL
jgi:DNA primase